MPKGICNRSIGIEERFYSRFRVDGSCWIWTAAICPGNGYGVLSVKNKMIPAHRISWELLNGQIPKGMDICHTCDVRSCINPKHLFVGSRKDNVIDMRRKGKGPIKLNWESVDTIRRSYPSENMSSLSRRFGVWPGTIRQIVNYITWKDEVRPEHLSSGVPA